jgi:hypothetical protein
MIITLLVGLCHECNLDGCSETVYFEEETGRVHDFCSRYHADMAIESDQWPSSNRKRQRDGQGDDQCSLPGCTAPRFYCHNSNQYYAFCGRTHAQKGAQRGVICRTSSLEPHAAEVVFPAGTDGATVAMLRKSSTKHENVKLQFLAAWQGDKPSVRRIYQVRNTPAAYQAYQSHCQQLSLHRIERRFHGTSQVPQCTLGSNVTAPPCNDPKCALCSICSSAFSIAKAGTNTILCIP